MLESLATTEVLDWLTNARFGEKIARVGISQFQVINILHQVQMFIDIFEFY